MDYLSEKDHVEDYLSEKDRIEVDRLKSLIGNVLVNEDDSTTMNINILTALLEFCADIFTPDINSETELEKGALELADICKRVEQGISQTCGDVPFYKVLNALLLILIYRIDDMR